VAHAPKLLALRELLAQCGVIQGEGEDASGGANEEDLGSGGGGGGHRLLVFAQVRLMHIIEHPLTCVELDYRFDELYPPITSLFVCARKRLCVIQAYCAREPLCLVCKHCALPLSLPLSLSLSLSLSISLSLSLSLSQGAGFGELPFQSKRGNILLVSVQTMS